MNRALTCRWLGATQTSSAFSMLDMCVLSPFSKAEFCCLRRTGRTFELPADFNHVWEWHTGGKVETDEFDNQPLDSQQPLSILFKDLHQSIL